MIDSNDFWYFKKKLLRERFLLMLLFLIFTLCLGIILFFIGFIIVKGLPKLSWHFLLDAPKRGMTEGGIFPAIMGTVLVTLCSSVVSIPIGVISGIYITEYVKNKKLARWISLAVKNLAGVPSVVYGLFGVALFLNTFAMHKSVLVAGLTLGILTLPIVISSTLEAIRYTPSNLRNVSYALGANRWQTIFHIIIPSAFPGILTGGIMAFTRAIGETAPILFVGVAYYIAFPSYDISSQFMSLSFHIFALVTQNSQVDKAIPLAYATSFVLMAIVFILNIITIYIRSKVYKRKKG